MYISKRCIQNHLAGVLTEQILTQAQSSRELIQDFVPLAESLEWDLGQEYLRQRGNKAFISDASPVPFVINNDGSLSRQCRRSFFHVPRRSRKKWNANVAKKE